MFIPNRRVFKYILAVAVAAASAVPAFAQPQRSPSRPQVEASPGSTFAQPAANARELRQEFRQLLSNYPPGLGQVLKLDPTLLTNDAYLSTFPALASFLKEHPEIARDPAFFLEHVHVEYDQHRPSEAVRAWNNMIEGLAVLAVMSLVATVLTWLVRTVIEHRRWSRLSKVQAEVNNKLFDRFSSNEDLLAYIQTPAGRRFLEGAPMMPTPSRPMGAPASRILLSVQAGIVIVAGGLGVLFVSGKVIDEIAQPMFAIASVGISLGIGFVVSSVVAYALSRNMGLIDPPRTGSLPGPESDS